MSIRIMSAVWENGPEDRGELLVLLALADFCDDAGRCYPSMQTVGDKARMTERSAQRVVRKLESAGWLSIDFGGGRGGTNVYTIHQNPDARVTPDIMSPRRPRQGGGDARVAQTPTPVSPEPSGTTKEPSEVKETPASVLCRWAGDEAVSSFIAYRRKHKAKALTVTAAKRLASNLQAIFDAGGDPDDALGMAEERGWASVQPDWYFNARSRQHDNRDRQAPANPRDRRYGSGGHSEALDTIALAARDR